MPLPIPRLDDHTFATLVREGEALIPRHAPGWTDRNPSDPGVALIELFAWLTETTLYQLDDVPEATLRAFLRMMDPAPAGAAEPLQAGLGRAVRALSRPVRAVTGADLEQLAAEAGARLGTPIARARFVAAEEGCAGPGDPGAPEAEGAPRPLAAALVVVPDEPDAERPRPSPELAVGIWRELASRRPLTTRLRVDAPLYVPVGVEAVVVPVRGAGLTVQRVRSAVVRFLHPLRGGLDGAGWPFGRGVYRSELFQLLEGIPGVDHVRELALAGDRPVPEGVEIPPTALVHAPPAAVSIRLAEG